MNTIKPTGGPTGPLSIDAITPSEAAEHAKASEATDGTAQTTEVSRTSAVQNASSAGAADTTERVLASLKSGEITPDAAIDRLVSAAIDKTPCPEALRPVIEGKIRVLLAADPHLRALTRQMGATPSSDD